MKRSSDRAFAATLAATTGAHLGLAALFVATVPSLACIDPISECGEGPQEQELSTSDLINSAFASDGWQQEFCPGDAVSAQVPRYIEPGQDGQEVKFQWGLPRGAIITSEPQDRYSITFTVGDWPGEVYVYAYNECGRTTSARHPITLRPECDPNAPPP